MLMLKSLKNASSFLSFLPLIVFFAYLSGYISLSSYLFSRQIPELPGLDSRTLKFGVLYCIITFPILYFVVINFTGEAKEKIDSLNKAQYSVYVFAIILLFLLKKHIYQYDLLLIVMIVITYGLSKIDHSTKEFWKAVKIIWFLAPTILIIYSEQYLPQNIFFGYEVVIFLTKFFGFISIAVLYMNLSKSNKYLYLITIFGVIIYFMTVFGSQIFKKIPGDLGGEKGRLTTFYFKKEFLEQVDCLPVYYTIVNGSSDLPVLFETAENVYVSTMFETACIPKSAILYSSNTYGFTTINPTYWREFLKIDPNASPRSYQDSIMKYYIMTTTRD